MTFLPKSVRSARGRSSWHSCSSFSHKSWSCPRCTPRSCASQLRWCRRRARCSGLTRGSAPRSSLSSPLPLPPPPTPRADHRGGGGLAVESDDDSGGGAAYDALSCSWGCRCARASTAAGIPWVVYADGAPLAVADPYHHPHFVPTLDHNSFKSASPSRPAAPTARRSAFRAPQQVARRRRRRAGRRRAAAERRRTLHARRVHRRGRRAPRRPVGECCGDRGDAAAQRRTTFPGAPVARERDRSVPS